MRTLHLISHTHWDREWYQPFQLFRLRLIHLVDNLLEILNSDPRYRYFMLDGQTIVLDDYLYMRPEREVDLRDHVRSGRLVIGPWHILPDEFLVSPEATIRNLLEGERTCRRFGPKMRVGYIPDPFGHIGQMPQILKGFGIHAACFRRGLSDEPCELWWEAPDGSRLFAAYLRDGYDNAASLPTSDRERFVSEVKRLRDNLLPHSAASHLLLMHGTDHMEPPPDTAEAIAYSDEKLDGDLLQHSTLTNYLTAVQAELAGAGIPTIRGELRSPKRHHLLPGVLSARMWIKQRNHACENLLEKWVEPFSTFASLVTADDRPQTMVNRPSSIVRQSWRLLMENHPHDSICGCSIDQVHDEMKVRFDQVEQIGEEMTTRNLAELAGNVNTNNQLSATSHQSTIVVFNPASSTRTDAATVEIEHSDFQIMDDDGKVLPHQAVGSQSRELINMVLNPAGLRSAFGSIHDGRAGNMNIRSLSIRRAAGKVFIEAIVSETGAPDAAAWKKGLQEIEMYLNDPAITAYHVCARTATATQIVFTAPDVPGLGYRTFWVRPRPVEDKAPLSLSPLVKVLLPLARLPFIQRLAARQRSARPPYKIENDFFTVEALKDGTLTVLDKKTSTTYRGLNRFVDGGDCGDEYNYAPPASERLIAARSKRVTLQRGPVQQTLDIELELNIPAALSAYRKSRSKERLRLPLTSRVTLTNGVPRIDIQTEVDNCARDHRLRVHFPAPLAAGTGQHDGHFEIVERKVGIPAFDDAWIEQPRPEVPQRAFTSVSDGKTGLTIANRGLPEVEVLKRPDGNAEIAVTLLRCIGWLSRDDFSTRQGHAGPMMETPGAQMPGKWMFEYSLIPYARQDSVLSYHQAYAFDAPLRAVATGLHTGALPNRQSFVEVSPPEFIVSAVKETQDSTGWLVRGYNLTGEELQVTLRPWRPFKSAAQINLAEEETAGLKPVEDGSVTLPVRGHEIATILFSD